jgi:hypothetical protein
MDRPTHPGPGSVRDPSEMDAMENGIKDTCSFATCRNTEGESFSAVITHNTPGPPDRERRYSGLSENDVVRSDPKLTRSALPRR